MLLILALFQLALQDIFLPCYFLCLSLLLLFEERIVGNGEIWRKFVPKQAARSSNKSVLALGHLTRFFYFFLFPCSVHLFSKKNLEE